VIGVEARAQMLEQAGATARRRGRLRRRRLERDRPVPPVRARSDVKLLGLEAGGTGTGLGQNAASLAYGTPGVLQGCYSLLLQDAHGQIQETHSVSAGPRLSGRRSRTRAARDDRPRRLRGRRGRRVARGARGVLRGGRHPARDRDGACVRGREALRASVNPGAARILIGLSGRGDKDMPTLQRTLLKGNL
jgi:tryptophan synthase beta chain